MCCDPIGAKPSDGEEDDCEDCGEPTYGGFSVDVCAYSPVLCHTCGNAPCDLSC